MKYLQLALILSGFGLWLFIILLVTTLIFDCIKEKIKLNKLEYMQKHRFDKPPTAKCYCIDCRRKDFGGHCDVVDKYVAEDWFCGAARPKTK